MSVPSDPVSITSATRSGTTLTCLVASTATLRTGDVADTYGFNQPEYNVLAVLTVVDATHFSIEVDDTASPVSPATGTPFYRKASGVDAPYIPFLGHQPGVLDFEQHQYPGNGETVTPQNSVVMFPRPATLTSFYGMSTAATQRWAMLFDATAVPADNTVPFRQVAVGSGTGEGDNFYLDVPPDGIRFNNGIVAAMSSTPDSLTVITDEAATFNADWHA